MDEQMIDDMANAMLKAQGFDLPLAEIDPRVAKQWRKLSRAAHSVIAGKVAELIELLLDAQADLNHLCDKYGEQEFIAPTICRITAALAPYPERRSE